MDLTRPVAYRLFPLNTTSKDNDVPIDGCQIDSVDYSPVEAYGYREKRSGSDGLDASDVFLGARIVRLSGTLYGKSLGDLYDTLSQFRAALLPTSAFTESPGDLGYLPLTFEESTLDLARFPTGYITKMMKVRAMNTPRVSMVRDHVGGVSRYGYSITWDVQMEAIDPRIYFQTPITTYFNAAANTSSGAGTVTNRGSYPAPLMIEMDVASASADRVITLTAFGSVTKITVPGPSGTTRVARYSGIEKYLTLDDNGTEVLRMDLLEFPSGLQHPLVPPGDSAFSWTSKKIDGTNQNVNALSRFWFWEAWA